MAVIANFPFLMMVRPVGKGTSSRSHVSVGGDSDIASQTRVTSSPTLRVMILGGATMNFGPTGKRGTETKIAAPVVIGSGSAWLLRDITAVNYTATTSTRTKLLGK